MSDEPDNDGNQVGPVTIGADDVRRLGGYRELVEALRRAFAHDWQVPQRWKMPLAGGADETQLLLMPASDGETLGVKLATIFPGNNMIGLPTIMASVILMDGQTGAPLALIDGTELTRRRTASASALAADYLARRNADHLLVVGTGALAPHMARAHAAVRNYRKVSIWGRDPKKAAAVAGALEGDFADAAVAEDLEEAVGKADVISTVTAATEPILLGKWLKPGAHLDLVGGHAPDARECDSEAVIRARVFVDVRESCLNEAGELIIPLGEGAISDEHILGDLADLARGKVPGRQANTDVTLFKSVGSALEDAAAARLVYDSYTPANRA